MTDTDAWQLLNDIRRELKDMMDAALADRDRYNSDPASFEDTRAYYSGRFMGLDRAYWLLHGQIEANKPEGQPDPHTAVPGEDDHLARLLRGAL